MEPSFCSVSFPTRTSVGRQPGSQLPLWSFPYTPVSLSPLEWPPLHLYHCLPTQGAPFSCKVLPCWAILPGFLHLMPSSRFYSFIRKRQICVGPRVLLDYHGGTQQLERGRSAGAKSSSYHSVQKELVTGTGAHPPGPDVRTLETLAGAGSTRPWLPHVQHGPEAQLQRNTKGGGSPVMLALGHTPI